MTPRQMHVLRWLDTEQHHVAGWMVRRDGKYVDVSGAQEPTHIVIRGHRRSIAVSTADFDAVRRFIVPKPSVDAGRIWAVTPTGKKLLAKDAA